MGNIHNFDRIEELLAKGDNVVVLANHQTEADPGRSRGMKKSCYIVCHKQAIGQAASCKSNRLLKISWWDLQDSLSNAKHANLLSLDF